MTVTPADKSPAKSAAPIALDPQRQLLQQLASLCAESAREERQIDADRQQQLTEVNAAIDKTRFANDQKRDRNLAAINQRRDEKLGQIEERFTAERAVIEQAAAQQRKLADREKEASDEQGRKQIEQAKWLAESVLEAIDTQIDVEGRQSKETRSNRLLELQGYENSTAAILARYEQAPSPIEPLCGETISERLVKEPDALFEEQKDIATRLLGELSNLSTPRLVAGGTPYLASIVACAAMGLIVQFAFASASAKWISAGVSVFVTLLACIAASMHLNRKARSEVVSTFVPLAQALDLARRAAESAQKTADEQRNQHQREARRKCAAEVDVARDRSKPIQRQAADKRSQIHTANQTQYQGATAALDHWHQQHLAELEQNHAAATEAAETAFNHERLRIDEDEKSRLEQIDTQYSTRRQQLEAHWNSALQATGRLLAGGEGSDAVPADWDIAHWEHWTSPRTFATGIPFGTLKINLAELTAEPPKQLTLPEAFTIPAMLAFPNRASVLIETDHASRPIAIATAGMVMARLLTHMPAGRVKFTIIDPVALGQSFAGFMHLADHDESLVGSRIWTENEHIEQRLADLTEHMETVIQKYLRNEYQTIDQYNAQAGELAEPVRYLVIADFPVGFEQDSMRRLASIATSGARCGVYTIIIRDTRQPLPQGSHYEELVARSIYLRFKEGHAEWNDDVFSKFPLTLDAPPDEKSMTWLMDRVGTAALEAKRVEVPFQTIAPRDADFWTGSSQNDLKVPIGKSGATRLQQLRLGVGVAQHALIAGKTGSGKSNLMHTIVSNLAMWYSPDEVEFYLIDFKKGVEFKAYVTRQLPHARAIAVESDREFGLSVLQRVDAELTHRGEMFRAAGVQEISSFRQQTGQKLPRTILLIDEFQEFFSEDDKLAQESALLLDRLVRQGRAFGVHVVLGSQTIGGSSGLGRSTLGQMAVRIALQCSEADSQMILGDNNSAARLLSRPGEAIYNDAGGLVEANSPFQIAFLPDDARDHYLERVQELCRQRNAYPATPTVVFEGSAPADIHKNTRLMSLLQSPVATAQSQTVHAWIGEPVSIKDPSSVLFRRQSGSNVLMVGQQEELALAIMSSIMISLGAQHAPDKASMVILDGTAADSALAGTLEKVAAALPQASQVPAWRSLEDALADLNGQLDSRQADADAQHPAIFLFVNAVQRYRMFRRQEDDFSFNKGEEEKPRPDKVFSRLVTEGPSLGIHVIVWADTAVTLDRTFDRGVLREFDNRILFQMSATDSSNLIDSPLANKLGMFRALAYSEELGTAEKFRPYQIPTEEWLAEVAAGLKR